MAYDIAIVAGITGVTAIFFYLAKDMMHRGDDKPIAIPMSILFMFAGFFTLLANLTVMSEIAEDAGKASIQSIIDGLYGPFLLMVIFVLAYIMITVFAEAAGLSVKWSSGEEEE